MRCCFRLMVVLAVVCGTLCILSSASAEEKRAPKPQYRLGDIVIPGAHADEPIRSDVSTELANDYLEHGALSWAKKRKCVSCHTTGVYLQIRPELTKLLGPPSATIRTAAIDFLRKPKKRASNGEFAGVLPTQSAYTALGLAEWDRHVNNGKLSEETDEALRAMFEMQSKDGTFGNAECWPPYESSRYHGTAIAAMAAATAPGWLAHLTDPDLKAGVENIKRYLQTTEPPHDFARLLLLWASTRWPDLIDAEQKQQLIETVWKHQRPDGGWSIRTFAEPEAWGDGTRAEKLREEVEFENPPSDGHQTGLAVVVLRDAGVSADDPRIQSAVKWLRSNQRVSGRWWTRSLNKDTKHYITFSGTAYPLLALAKCNALPAMTREASKVSADE